MLAAIGPEDAERLFMPFKRLSHHKAQGPGLGLAACRKIIELHGGKIWHETKPGAGARFIFSIPKVQLAEAINVAGQPIPQEKNRGGCEKRIATLLLLVDDDGMALELAQIQLIDINRLQCRVLVAHDGLEALARLRDTEIDLVLLDINMPRMDGFELLERMRVEKFLEYVPVVMCSTSTYQEDISKAKDLGACGYLPKPPDLSRLLALGHTNAKIPESGSSPPLIHQSEFRRGSSPQAFKRFLETENFRLG
jgi:CheY-like chemotaxis protein